MESVLAKATEKEKKYDWLEAAKLYEQALGMVKKGDFLRRGEVQEKIGYCFCRGAFQAENPEEFKGTMAQAIETYKKAYGIYEKLKGEQKTAKLLRSTAIIKYLDYWLTSDPLEKRKLLDESLESKSKALAASLVTGDMLEYARTYGELFLAFFCRVTTEWDRQTLKSIVERELEWGEKAVVALSEFGNLHELAKANLISGACSAIFRNRFIADPEQKDKDRLKAVKYLNKAVDLSEKVGDAYVLGLAHLWLGVNTGGEEALRHVEKGLECGKHTRDNWLIAWGMDMLAPFIYWEATATEDPRKRMELAEKAMQYYDEGQHHFSIISYLSPRGGIIGPPAGHAEHYLHLAMWETDSRKRLEFLEKSEKVGMEALKLAEDSDSPEVISIVLHVVSKTLETRARIEPEPKEKRSYLEKALKYRRKTVEIGEQLTPFDYWNRGVMQNYLAGIKAELADTESDLECKGRLLEEAVLSKEKCLKLCNKIMPYYQKMGDVTYFAALQGYQDTYATLLTRLYNLTNKPEHLRKAIEISQEAIESASKLAMVSLIAESYWRIANTQNFLKEHLKSAESFKLASENYTKAAEKIPQLKDFYRDHTSYMEAWSEIEKAKHRHATKQYGLARDHYKNAANLHRSTERWNHFTSNYLALARFEHAEDLSRRGQSEEAREVFQQAADLFAEARKSLEEKLETAETNEEKQTTSELAEALPIRREYSIGRMLIEEAKILDRQGDHADSSRKYALAVEKFQKLADAMKSEPDRMELKPIVFLSQAWHAMTRAEAEASPELYLEASRLFDEAKKYSVDETGRVLALGHSSFCKALEAGTRFEATGDMGIYSTAKKNLEAAARYYLKAGFNNGSKYAKATHRLFDAYMYTNKADMETDPEKKAQFYQMAERLLQTSAGLYVEARHPEKGEQVQRLLEDVKEERQMATSLRRVLHAPATTSTTTSFSIPTPTREQAVGLERFEHADVQANLIFRVKEAKVGDDIVFRIEMVNAGKAPALLVKVDELVPEGFEIKEVPEIYTVEDSYINMKGKTLNPLKTEDIKVVVTPQSKGTHVMKPRILYLDEAGKYKFHEPEPVRITVEELGISGWIKGEK